MSLEQIVGRWNVSIEHGPIEPLLQFESSNRRPGHSEEPSAETMSELHRSRVVFVELHDGLRGATWSLSVHGFFVTAIVWEIG